MATQPAPDHVPVQRKEGAHTQAGGRYSLVSDYEVVHVLGYPVQIAQRVDGAWFAKTVDYRLASRRRQWLAGGGHGKDAPYTPGDRDALMARIEADLAANPPQTSPTTEVPQAPAQPAQAAPYTNGTATHAQGGEAATWRAVSVDLDEFPLAAAMAALDAALAPALAALDAAGKADAAALVRGELTRTPVEDELVRLYRRVTEGA